MDLVFFCSNPATPKKDRKVGFLENMGKVNLFSWNHPGTNRFSSCNRGLTDRSQAQPSKAKHLFQEVLKLSVFDLMEQALQLSHSCQLEMRMRKSKTEKGAAKKYMHILTCIYLYLRDIYRPRIAVISFLVMFYIFQW